MAGPAPPQWLCRRCLTTKGLDKHNTPQRSGRCGGAVQGPACCSGGQRSRSAASCPRAGPCACSSTAVRLRSRRACSACPCGCAAAARVAPVCGGPTGRHSQPPCGCAAAARVAPVCVTAETRHLDRRGQLGEVEQGSSTEACSPCLWWSTRKVEAAQTVPLHRVNVRWLVLATTSGCKYVRAAARVAPVCGGPPVRYVL